MNTDELKKFISHVKSAHAEGTKLEKQKTIDAGDKQYMLHDLQVASMIGKRLARAMGNPKFSQAVRDIESASVEPDVGDKMFYLGQGIERLKSLKMMDETTVAGDVAGKDVSLFSGKDKIAKVKSVAEAVQLVLEKKLPVDVSTKIKNAEQMDPKVLEKLGGKYDIEISMKVFGKHIEFDINGSVGGHEDLNVLGSELRDLVDGRNFSYNFGLKKSKVSVVF